MNKISEIRTDGGTQSRAAINEATVAEYAEAMADPSTAFPPAIVYYDGKDYWLADGFHRVAAWARVGRDEVPTEIRQGSRRDAILHSCAANSAHGLRRTNDDKRRAVETLLRDDEWSQWSDNEISRRCAVSQPFVGKMRAALTSNVISEERTYTTKHGTEAKMDTSRIGAGSELDRSQPGADSEAVHETSDTSGADNAGISVANDAADGPAPAQKPDAPDPHAKLRAEYRKLTDEAREDDWINLRLEIKEAGARIAKQRSQISDLKQTVKDLSEGSDMGAKISRLMEQLGAAKFTRDEAMRKAKAMEYRLKQAEKRADQAEEIEIPYA